jgi:hypothetical protein
MSAVLSYRLPARWANVEVTDLDPCGRQHRAGAAPRCGVAVDEGIFANPFDTEALLPTQRMGALIKYAVRLAGRRAELLAVRDQLAGRDVSCTCALDDPACHRNVLLDVANPPARPFDAGGRTMAVTVRRPWASLLLVPAEHGGKNVENRTWATDYRGPVMIYAGARVDHAGLRAAQRAGFDVDWHQTRRGWLGAAVLTDVHRASGRCCRPWGQRQPGGNARARPTIHHWVFEHPHRLAAATWAQGEKHERRGFEGMRAMSWAVLMRTPK